MSKRSIPLILILVIISIAIICLIIYFKEVSSFFLELFAAFKSIETARDYISRYGILAPVISAILMIFQSIIAIVPLPAFLITVANGALFGFGWGLLLSWSSAMLGAVLCFYIARYLGAKQVARIISQPLVDKTDQFIEKYGSHAILIARLIPYIPFDVVSYVAGLTRMRFIGFLIATGIGQLPATAVYTFLGGKISIHTRLMLYGFGITVSVLIVIWLVKKRKSIITKNEYH